MKIKVKIINGFRKTSGFGWRFTPKWKQEFIKLNGMNRFELLVKGKNIQNEIDRKSIIDDLKSKFLTPQNSEKYPKVFNFHNGLDFAGSDNKLLAIADGTIIRSNYDDLSGNYIKIKHTLNGVDYVLSYCHLKYLVQLKKGDVINVTKGEWIAVMGATGVTVTGVHCHLTVKEVLTSKVVNPEDIFEFE